MDNGTGGVGDVLTTLDRPGRGLNYLNLEPRAFDDTVFTGVRNPPLLDELLPYCLLRTLPLLSYPAHLL